MNKKERLQMVFDYLKQKGKVHKQTEFADFIGISKSNLSSALSGNERYLTDNLFVRIKAAYSDFNEEWLYNGTGTMLISQACEPLTRDEPYNAETDSSDKERVLTVLEELSQTMKKQADTMKQQSEQLAEKDKKIYEFIDKLIQKDTPQKK